MNRAAPEWARPRQFVLSFNFAVFRRTESCDYAKSIVFVPFLNRSWLLMLRDSSCNEVKQFLSCGFRDYKADSRNCEAAAGDAPEEA